MAEVVSATVEKKLNKIVLYTETILSWKNMDDTDVTSTTPLLIELTQDDLTEDTWNELLGKL